MKALKVLAIGVVVGGISLAVGTQAHAEAWTPRTVDQIKADIAKTNGKEYTIIRGDTMWGISQATNLTVQKLADINKIANVDLIYAGNKLVFEGSVVSVENAKGDTVAQTVIQSEDKVDPEKPVGQSVQGKDTTSDKKDDIKTDKNVTADSKADTKKADVKSDGSDSENGKQADSTPSENKDGLAETPSQPANNANQNDVAGGSSNQGQTTPNTPANNSGETPSTPSNNGGASNQQSTSGNQSGSTTSSQTTTPTNPSSGNQGGTVQQSTETPKDNQVQYLNLGNSGMIFNTEAEADAYGYKEISDKNSTWYDYGFEGIQLLDKNYDLTGQWTVNFFKKY